MFIDQEGIEVVVQPMGDDEIQLHISCECGYDVELTGKQTLALAEKIIELNKEYKMNINLTKKEIKYCVVINEALNRK